MFTRAEDVVGGGAGRAPGVKAKMEPPKLQPGVDQQTWDQFMARCEIFKTILGVDSFQVVLTKWTKTWVARC